MEGRLGDMLGSTKRMAVVEAHTRMRWVARDSRVVGTPRSAVASDTLEWKPRLEIGEFEQVHIDRASSSFVLPSPLAPPVLAGTRVAGS